MKVCFETFGCRLNKAEALEMEAAYLADGWETTARHADADLIVVRGCSVTARAQRDCEKLIAHLKRRYPCTRLLVCGCLSGKSKGMDATERVPPASRPGGTGSVPSASRPGGTGSVPSAIPPSDAPVPTRTARAYLKVQDGCSGRCTFCIVPKFRGASVSVPFGELLDKARRFVDAGYREIVVTGCNLSLYASGGKRLPELVSALASVSPDCRVRLGSVEPGACAMETVRAMAESANVCRFLHVPVQSGSNRILAAMKRPYLVRDVEALVLSSVKFLPNLGLGCDVMTGFPDESALDFAATEGLLRRLPFNRAHVFPYSERPGTLAAGFGGAVPKDVRSARAHRLSELAARKRAQFARRFVGQEVEIVVEDEGKAVGWTGEYLRCRAATPAPRKSRVRVLVTRVLADATLEGRLTRECRFLV